MKLIPDHKLIYKGILRLEGVPFEIDPADAEELKQYGKIKPEKPANQQKKSERKQEES